MKFNPPLHFVLLLVIACTCFHVAFGMPEDEDPIFSGPQVGEALPDCELVMVLGKKAGEEISLLEETGDRPIVIFFVHKLTRPGFAMANSLVQFAKSKNELNSAVVYLNEDHLDAAEWMKKMKARGLFPDGALYATSKEGLDGPGAYGLNRNVNMTILVAEKEKVVANFALRQPSLQVDGPKVLSAIVKVTGGEVPTIEALQAEMAKMRGGRNMRTDRKQPKRDAVDPELGGLVRGVIQKDATDKEVVEAAARVKKYVTENENAKKQLGRIATTIANSDRLETYGTKAAQEVIKAWAKEFGPNEPESDNESNRDQGRKDDTPNGEKPKADNESVS